MKNTIITLTLLISSFAFAKGGVRPTPSPDLGGGRGGEYSCTAHDKGWEEHGSHSSCSSCLLKHGNCVERCGYTFYTCEAIVKDSQGIIIDRETIRGRDRFLARTRAEDFCFSASRQGRTCDVSSCTSNYETTSIAKCVGSK